MISLWRLHQVDKGMVEEAPKGPEQFLLRHKGGSLKRPLKSVQNHVER